MNAPDTEHTVCAAINDIVVTMQELLEKRRTFPALILLYSGIDIFGSWLRPKSNPDTSGADFKCWTERYLLKKTMLKVRDVHDDPNVRDNVFHHAASIFCFYSVPTAQK